MTSTFNRCNAIITMMERARPLSTLMLVLWSLSPSSADFSYQRYLEGRALPQESYVIDGDLMIGVILPISFVDHELVCGKEPKIDALELIYGFKYAIDNINNNNGILPGTRIGMYIMDDCQRAGMSIIRLLQAISDPQEGPMPGPMSLNMTYPVLGILGLSEPTALVAGHAAMVYRVPLIVPLSASERFANRFNYPTVWSPTPSNAMLPEIMLKLVAYFRWTYFTLLYEDKSYGILSYKRFYMEAPRLGMCVADSIMFYQDMDYEEAAHKVIAAKAEVLVVAIGIEHLQKLFETFDLLGHNTSNYHLIMSHMGDYDYVAPWRHRVLGSVQFKYQEPFDQDIWSYLTGVWPSDEPDNPWLQRFWSERGWDTSCNAQSDIPCYNLSHIIQASRTPLLSRAAKAMYAMAQAIHNVIQRKCPDAFGNMELIMACVTPSDVNGQIPLVRVETQTGMFSFNRRGDANMSYDIFQEQGPIQRMIGTYDMSTDRLHIDNSILDWGSYNWSYQENTSFPYHRCSAPCPIAHFKVVGDQFCCWQCFACRSNQILVDNETSCEVCPDKQWPLDETQMDCIDIPHTYLTWDNLYGAILTGLSGVGLLLALILTIVTTKEKNLRVVKGSGLQMLLVILCGIYLAFATVFAHTEKPSDGLCIFGRIGFHLSFTLIFGPMLVKTSRLCQVFLAASKSGKIIMGSDLSQHVALTIIILMQIGLTVASLVLWPTRAVDWMPIKTERYVELYCDVPQMSLIVGTSFNLLLIAACCLLAFIARGLPDNFNESWYTFLCVVTTLFIWIAFFTTYFSAFYVVYKTALLAAALILNALVVVVAFFGPKIYAIAFVADKDIKLADFEGSMNYVGQTESSVVSNKSNDNAEK